VKALQKLAGHSRIETTMRYMHPDQEDVLNIVSTGQRKKSSGVAAVFATVAKQETRQTRKM
jgi:hypothetical protein